MTTAISICSNALLQLGAGAIASFDENNDRARLCANLYPQERDALLRSHYWNCAIKRAVLPPLADAPAFEWRRAFALPGDWLRTLSVRDASGYLVDFRQEGRALLADVGELRLRYVWRNDVEGTWDELLVAVMTLRMKALLCYPVTKSTSLRESLLGELKVLMQQTKSIDAMDEPGETVAEESALLAVRR